MKCKLVLCDTISMCDDDMGVKNSFKWLLLIMLRAFQSCKQQIFKTDNINNLFCNGFPVTFLSDKLFSTCQWLRTLQ